MEANQQKINRVIPESYMHITYEMRKKLIHLVQQEKVTIPESCKILGVKKSTAKSILRQFRRKGKIFRRKCEKKVMRKKVDDQKQTLNNSKQPTIPENEQHNSISKPQHSSEDNLFFDMNQYGQIHQSTYWIPTPYFYPVYPNYSFGFF